MQVAGYEERFMDRAIEIAVRNVYSDRGGPFGAVIVCDGEIIAESGNEVLATNDPTAHAEIEAIRSACRLLESVELRDCTLYTSCEPCPMCLGAIYWSRLAQVFYAGTRKDASEFDDASIYDEIALDPPKRSIPMTPVTHLRSAEPFVAWSRKADRQKY